MKNIEFYTTPQGEIEIRSEEGVRTYTRECKEITSHIFSMIESDYPQAHKALCAEYKRSADNPSYFSSPIYALQFWQIRPHQRHRC